mgnify:CR=1 FL=1
MKLFGSIFRRRADGVGVERSDVGYWGILTHYPPQGPITISRYPSGSGEVSSEPIPDDFVRRVRREYPNREVIVE